MWEIKKKNIDTYSVHLHWFLQPSILLVTRIVIVVCSNRWQLHSITYLTQADSAT
jgi:hypothetical protein